MKYSNFLFCALLAALPAWAGNAAQSVQGCDQALQSGDFVQAATHAEAALRDAPDNRDAFLCLGRAQGGRGNNAEAVAALLTAEKLSVQPVEHIVALTLLGNQYQSAKSYAQAIDAYRQSLAIARTEKSARFELINLNQIGEALEGAGDPSAALEHYLQGLKLAANDNERADSNARIAAAHSVLGDHDKAIEHQLKAMLFEERSGDLNHYAHANIELGRICLAAKQYADAEKWLGKFLETIAQTEAPYWQAKARYMLGKVKTAKGSATEAAEQFSQAKALAQKIGAEQLLKEIAEAESTAKSR